MSAAKSTDGADRVRGAEAPSAHRTVRTGPYTAPHARRIDQSSADQCGAFLAAQLVWVVRRSIGLVDACHSLYVGPSSICAVAVRPVFTSRPGVLLLFRADLGLTVFHALRFRLRVPPFTSSLLATDSMFYPHRRHRRITGTELYDSYGFICRPPSHHVSRLRAA